MLKDIWVSKLWLANSNIDDESIPHLVGLGAVNDLSLAGTR
jgi:hypothetical protein